MALNQHNCHEDKDWEKAQFLECAKVARSWRRLLGHFLSLDKVFLLVVDLTQLGFFEHMEDFLDCILRLAVDYTLLFRVVAFGLESHTSRVHGLSYINVTIVSCSIQSNLSVDIVTSLSHKLVEVVDNEAQWNHKDNYDLASVVKSANLVDKLEWALNHHHSHHRWAFLSWECIEYTASWRHQHRNRFFHLVFVV